MPRVAFKTTALLLLSLMTAGGQVLAPLVASADEKQPFFLNEVETDSEEIEELSKLTLAAVVDGANVEFEVTGFHPIYAKVNHQIDWLFIHEHSARAPPSV